MLNDKNSEDTKFSIWFFFIETVWAKTLQLNKSIQIKAKKIEERVVTMW
jgi:hypothetical protein